jgi:hypothetical protein
MSKQVQDQSLFFVVGCEVRNVPHHWVGQVKEPPLDKHHRSHVCDRFGDRGEQEHAVASNFAGTRFCSLSTEEVRLDDLPVSANDDSPTRHRRIRSGRPLAK